MPIYIFKNPEKEDYIEVTQKMNDAHVYSDESGVKWERVWTIPQASIDTIFDAHNEADFVNKTANKKGNLGNLFDKSKELSEQRKKDLGGVDPIQEKYYDTWKKTRNTHLDHPEKIKRKTGIDPFNVPTMDIPIPK